MPLMPEGEVLFVNLDPRAVLDVESSMRTTWPLAGGLGADPSRICLEIIKPERCPDREMLEDLVAAHRKRGALVALDDLSGGSASLAFLELLKPDIAKIDTALTAGIQYSGAAAASSTRSSSARTSAARGGRGGGRARRRVRGDARPRRRFRPGLLLRPADRAADGGGPAPRARAARAGLISCDAGPGVDPGPPSFVQWVDARFPPRRTDDAVPARPCTSPTGSRRPRTSTWTASGASSGRSTRRSAPRAPGCSPAACTRRRPRPWSARGATTSRSPTARTSRASEHVGGFTILEADDLDAALGWAGRIARITGLPVEVRPFQHG